MNFKSPYLPYYFFHFIYILGVSFTKTTFVPYLKTKGITGSDLHTALAIFSATVILAEIPLLGINLKLGPFRSFLLGSLFKFLTALAFIFGTAKGHFYFAEFISGIAVCLISGSLDAWLMSRIEKQGASNNSKKLPIFAFAERLDKLALAIGGSIGAMLAHVDLKYSWYGVGTIFLIVCILGSFFYFTQETQNKGTVNKPIPLLKRLKTNIHHVLKNPNFVYLSLHSFFISFALSSPKMLWIPIVKEHFGKNFLFIGKMWLLLCAIQFLGTFGVKRWAHTVKHSAQLKVKLASVSCLLLIGMIFSQNSIPLFILFFFLIEGIQPYHQVATQGITFDNGNEEERTSALSSFSAFSKIGNVAGLTLASFLYLKFETPEKNYAVSNAQVWSILASGYFILNILAYRYFFRRKNYSDSNSPSFN